MFPNNKAIKKTALESLKSHWPQAIAIALILFLLNSFPTLLYQGLTVALSQPMDGDFANIYTVLNGLWILFIGSPVLMGAIHWFWIITAGETAPISLLFYYFSSKSAYGTAFKVSWAFGWRVGLAEILIYFPDVLIALAGNFGVDIAAIAENPIDFSNISLALIFAAIVAVGSVFCVVGFFLIIFKAVIPLIPLPISVINYQHKKIADNVRETYILSKNFTGKYIGLFFSMIGWILLSAFIIPQIFTIPYFIASYALLTRFIIFHKTRR